MLTGEYLLKKDKTLEGYILPGGTWTVMVDADKPQIDIKKTNPDDETPDFVKVKQADGTYLWQVTNKKTLPFSFTKVDGTTEEPLLGVQFALYACGAGHTEDRQHSELATENQDNSCWVLKETVTSDASGRVEFPALSTGEYQLVETKTLEGYELPLGQWRIHVNAATGEISVSAIGKPTPPAFQEVNGKLLLGNQKRSILPLAGGNGLKRYYAIGALLIVLAGILFCYGKRRCRE